MRSTIVNVLAGVAGNIAYYFVDRALLSLTGAAWWFAMTVVFAACFAAAAVVQRRKQSQVLSRNRAKRDQHFEVEKAATTNRGDASILSDNIAGRDQTIKAGEIRDK